MCRTSWAGILRPWCSEAAGIHYLPLLNVVFVQELPNNSSMKAEIAGMLTSLRCLTCFCRLYVVWGSHSTSLEFKTPSRESPWAAHICKSRCWAGIKKLTMCLTCDTTTEHTVSQVKPPNLQTPVRHQVPRLDAHLQLIYGACLVS